MEILKVIKIGGNIIDNPIELKSFLAEFSKLKGPKILVHGGGKLATQLSHKMGLRTNMNNGRRVTDSDTLEMITMVYAGKINKHIVVQLQALYCNSIGFSGADGNTIISVKRPVKEVDFGFVGDVTSVNTKTLQLLLNHEITPVFCAITHDANGQLLNTNADTIASELAIAFSKIYKTELYYCFEKSGVLDNIVDETSVIENINIEIYNDLIKKDRIAEGMLPKLSNCFHALENDVNKICIGKPEMLFNTNSKFTTIQS